MNVKLSQVVIVGASARALAQSANRAGYKVIVVDQFADFDTQQVAQVLPFEESHTDGSALPFESNGIQQKLEQAIDPQSKPVSTVYVGGLENKPELVERLAKVGNLLGNPRAALERLHDRFALHEFLQRSGFQVPQSFTQADFRQWAAGTSQQTEKETSVKNTKWLKKKKLSCGGIGIQLVRLPDDLNQILNPDQNLKPDDENCGNDFYYQRLVDGQVFSASFLACSRPAIANQSEAKVKLIGITKQFAGDPRFNAPGFLYSGSMTEPNPPLQLIKFATSIGQHIAEEYGLQGLFNIDFVQADDGFYFLEVNPRYSASMELYERQDKSNLFEWLVEACQTSTTEKFAESSQANQPKPSSRRMDHVSISIDRVEAKAIWYAEQSCIVDSSFPEFALKQKDCRGLSLIADIPSPGTWIRQGHPAFTVFASGDSQSRAAEKLVETARMFASLLMKSATEIERKLK